MMRTLLATVLLVALLALTGCGTAILDVKGMSAAEAASALKSAGFPTGTPVYDAQSVANTGSVIAQAPEAGDMYLSGITQ